MNNTVADTSVTYETVAREAMSALLEARKDTSMLCMLLDLDANVGHVNTTICNNIKKLEAMIEEIPDDEEF